MAVLERPPPLKFWKEFQYNDDSDLPVLLKVYLPQKDEEEEKKEKRKYDVVTYCHGGAGITGDSEDYCRPLFKRLLDLRVVIVSADYRLLPHSTVKDIFEDIKRLEGWLQHDLAKKLEGWNLNTSRFLVIGGSFGGYLALKTVDLWETTPLAVVTLYPLVAVDEILPVERHLKVLPQINQAEILNIIMQEDPISQFPPATKEEDLQHPRHLLARMVFAAGIFFEFLLRGVSKHNGSWRLPGKLCAKEIIAIAPLNEDWKPCPPIYALWGASDDISPPTIHSKRLQELTGQRGSMYTEAVVPGKGHAFDIEAKDGSEIDEKYIKPIVIWIAEILGELPE